MLYDRNDKDRHKHSHHKAWYCQGVEEDQWVDLVFALPDEEGVDVVERKDQEGQEGNDRCVR